MTEFSQITVGVITLAATYALVAVGWNVVHAVTGVLNLAQGEFFMIGGIVLATNMERGLPLALALALVAPLGVAMLTEVVLLRPLANRGKVFQQVIVTLSLAIFLRELVAWVVGPDPLFGPTLVPGGGTVEVFGAFVLRQAVLLWITTAVVGVALWLLFARSTLGAAMRACAESPEGAATIGLSLVRLRLVALGIAGLLGGLAGALVASMTPVAFNSGTIVGLKGFMAAAVGGLGSISGGFVGSVLLAALEGYFAGYVSDTYRDVLVYGVLIVIVMIRPNGLLGRRRAARGWWRRGRRDPYVSEPEGSHALTSRVALSATMSKGKR